MDHEAKARELVSKWADYIESDPYNGVSGCSINRCVEEIATALRVERERALEEVAKRCEREAKVLDGESTIKQVAHYVYISMAAWVRTLKDGI